MIIRSDSLPKRDAYRLLSSVIVPRPIALVTTVSSGGVVNAAPFSFFNAICSDPPMVMLSISDRRRGERKDTARNILGRRECVINVVSEHIAQSMNLCSGDYPPEVSEVVIAGFTTQPSEIVSTPRIAESLVGLECTLEEHITIGRAPNDLLIGAVHAFHVADAIIIARSRPALSFPRKNSLF